MAHKRTCRVSKVPLTDIHEVHGANGNCVNKAERKDTASEIYKGFEQPGIMRLFGHTSRFSQQAANAGLQLRRAISIQAEGTKLLKKHAIAPSAARLCYARRW
jgi:hypothetical protein